MGDVLEEEEDEVDDDEDEVDDEDEDDDEERNRSDELLELLERRTFREADDELDMSLSKLQEEDESCASGHGGVMFCQSRPSSSRKIQAVNSSST